ncbi:MAG: hypothetical protein AM326_08060 [Candidatus Thorarchaeota archaeon SMTZ-45]|nr:MAG: hypothetical protein AM325_05830 [Candidatus Thorarchaeota archaeon SMTZ1-45]KXH76015.1 MAG: hypothetical protein AM326_08060 [Candidatus Thorarchaeota archaeon SMTZ-45]
MRIAAVSDIHVLPNGSDELLLTKIKERVEEIDPDVFVIAGDISDRLDVLSDALSKLQAKSCENLFVSGNHDIWFEEQEGPGSLEKYSRIIGEVCKRNGFSHIPDAPIVLEDYAFIGSIGWYDYSFKRDELNIPMKNYEQKEYQGAIWYDLLRLDWEFSDREATDLFNRKIEYDLKTLPEDCKYVIYVSHHLPFQDLTIYKNKLPWDFHGAFMGATSTGHIIKSDERILLSVSGHSHVRNMVTYENLVALTVPVGYGRPEPRHLEDFVKDAIAIIDLDEKDVKIHDFVRGDLSAGLPFASSRN